MEHTSTNTGFGQNASSLRRQLRTGTLVLLVAVLITAVLPLSPAVAQELAPRQLVGVFDADFNVSSDQYTAQQQATIDDAGTAAGSQREFTLWLRNLGDACQRNLVVRITNPVGEQTVQRPFKGCDNRQSLLSATVQLPAAGPGTWTIAYRSDNDQEFRIPAVRIDAFGPIASVEPVNPFLESQSASGITLLGGEVEDATTPEAIGPENPTPDLTLCPTGVVFDARLALNVVMTGPYDPTTGLMNDALRTFGAIPTIDPYFGREVVDPSVFDVTGPDAIVDWVVVELRYDNPHTHPDGVDPIAHVPPHWAAQVPALIQRDGDVVGTDGVSPVAIPANQLGKYRPVVWHRSHAPTAFPRFTHLQGQVVQASPNWTPLAGTDPNAAPWDMIAGDANGDFDINGEDKGIWANTVGTWTSVLPDGRVRPGAYANADFNMDGDVNGADKSVWEPLNGTSFFPPGDAYCEPGVVDNGNAFDYPDIAFGPDYVSSYSYQVIVDQLFVAPNLEGDVSTNNPADNEVERNRVVVSADLDFTGYAIEDNQQWVKLDVTDASMTPTSGRYANSTFAQVDQTTPIPAANVSPSEWSEDDVWVDTQTPNQSLASELAQPTYFLRNLDGTVVEIIHPISANGDVDSVSSRNIKEGMINLLSMKLAGATDDFSVMEQDRSGHRPVEYDARATGGTITINRSVPGGSTPPGTEGVTAGTIDTTIVVDTAGGTTSIVSSEIIEIDEESDVDTVDASDPFADLAPLKARVWTQSTLTVAQVPVALANPSQASADALTERTGSHIRSVLSQQSAEALHAAAEIENNAGIEADVRADLALLPDVFAQRIAQPTFEVAEQVMTTLRLFPASAMGLATDAAAGTWSNASTEIVVGALGSVGNRQSQLALVEFASTVTDDAQRQMAIISMVLLDEPIDEVIDYLTGTVTGTTEEDAWSELVAGAGEVTVGSDVVNSAMLVLGSLGGRLEDAEKADAVQATLAAVSEGLDVDAQRVAGDALENFAANRPASDTPPAAFEPAPSAAEAFRRSASAETLGRPSGDASAKVGVTAIGYPVGGEFWGHCGWDDASASWVAAGVSSGAPVPDADNRHVLMFGHPSLGSTPSVPGPSPIDEGTFLVATPGDCDRFSATGVGVASHFYGHCVRTQSDISSTGLEWIEPAIAPQKVTFHGFVDRVWVYSDFPGSVVLSNRTEEFPWGNPPMLSSHRSLVMRIAPGECRLLNDNQQPDPDYNPDAPPPVTPSSTGEPDNEGFHWEKQFGPDFVHADLYASLDLPRSGDRGAVFRAEAGANATIAGRTATLFRAKAESALDLVDENSADNFGVNNQIGQIERDLTLQAWFFNNKVVDKEIGVPCGVGASGEFFQVPSLNLGFSKTIMVAGFIPVEFAGGLGANLSAPWNWSADSCDIFFGSEELVTLAGLVGIEGRAEAHLTAGINLVLVKGGGGVGGTLIGFGANAGASLQLFRPSANRGPELCFSFTGQLIPPSISAYLWYKLLFKKKKTVDLFSWNPTFPPPVNLASSCPRVESHNLTVLTAEPGDLTNSGGPIFDNPSYNGHLLAVPSSPVEGLINNPGNGVQLRVQNTDGDVIRETIAAFCAQQGYGAPVVDLTVLTPSDDSPGSTLYARVDGAWGYDEAGIGFEEITQITCAVGDLTLSSAIVDPATGNPVSANSPTGAVIPVPDGVTETDVVFTITNIGTATIHQLAVDPGSLGGTPTCPTSVDPGTSVDCILDLDLLSATGQVANHVANMTASETANGPTSEFGSFNFYSCLGCAPSGGNPGGTNPTGSDPDPVPAQNLAITDVEIKASDVIWQQNATGAVVPHVETPTSVSVFVTVLNNHSEAVTDLEFQGTGLNESGNCTGATVDMGDSITCKIPFVPVSAGLNDRTVKAFGVGADAVSQPVFSNLQNWKVFGEDLRLSVTGATIGTESAITDRPGIDQDETITFTISNPGGSGAVDLDDLRLTGAGLANVDCPFRLDVNDSATCTATVVFDENVTDSVEFVATISAEGAVSDRSTTTDVTWGWSAPDRPWQRDIEITELIALRPSDGTAVASHPSPGVVDVRVTVRNNSPTEDVTDLHFDLVSATNSCDGFVLGPNGTEVDCILAGVAVAAGPQTFVVQAEGSTASADVHSDPMNLTLMGEVPGIEITAISLAGEPAMNPRAVGGVVTALTNPGVEEGTLSLAVTISNPGSSFNVGAVGLSDISIDAVGLENVTCPASLPVGASVVCEAEVEVIPTDDAVTRTVVAKAKGPAGSEVTDQRAWSWSYEPRFRLEMLYNQELAPGAVTQDPGTYLVGVRLTNSGEPGVLQQFSFNEAELTLSGGQGSPARECNPNFVPPTNLLPGEVIECDLFVDILALDQTAVVTATVDGVAKSAALDLIAGTTVEVVDVGEPPTGVDPDPQWGTGTGGFVITPVAGEAMPDSVTFAGRVITGAELDHFSHVFKDTHPYEWEIEILPRENETGRRTLTYVDAEGLTITHHFHVVAAGPFDELFNHLMIDVTEFTQSYTKIGDAFNTVELNLPEGVVVRQGSVLVHQGDGDNGIAPDGFVQVVDVVNPDVAEGLVNGRVSSATFAQTNTGDLLDVFRRKKSRNSQTVGESPGKKGSPLDFETTLNVTFTSSFTPEFELDIDLVAGAWYNFFWPSPTLMYFRVGAHASAGIAYEAAASVAYQRSGTFPILGDKRLLTFPIGPVPVSVNLALDGVWEVAAHGEVRVEGGVGVEVSAFAEYEHSSSAPASWSEAFTKGFDYQFHGCEDLEGADLEQFPIGNSCFKPQYSGSFSASAGVDIRISMLVADTVGPSVAIGPRLGVSAGVTQNGVSYGLETDLGLPGLGLVPDDGLENARILQDGPLEVDQFAAGADGLGSKSDADVRSKVGIRFKGIAKRVIPQDIDLDVGSILGAIPLTQFSSVYGVIVNLCAWGSLDFGQRFWNPWNPGVPFERADVVEWRPPGHNNLIRWHGHHIVRKDPGSVPELGANYLLVEEVGDIAVLSSCRNLVWAPNDARTPGHHRTTPVNWSYMDLFNQLRNLTTQQQVFGVLDTWSERSCLAYKDGGNPLNTAESTRMDAICDL